MKNILLIGSNGFLGKTLEKMLISDNRFEYLNISGKSFLDIRNYDALNNYLKYKNIEIIFNCAAFVGGIAFGYKYQKDLISLNSQFALNIYKAAEENSIKKIINPISNCIYPSNLTEYKEENIFDGLPHSSVLYYGLSKRFLINLSNAFYEQSNISSCNLIMSNMYGPGDHFEEERSHAIGAIIKKVYDTKFKKNKYIEIWGSGSQEREWLYVNDAAEAMIRSLELNDGVHTFNVGVNKTISIQNLAELIIRESGIECQIKNNLNKPEGVLKKSVNGDLGKSLLGWTPNTDIIEGIRNTINWYEKNEISKRNLL